MAKLETDIHSNNVGANFKKIQKNPCGISNYGKFYHPSIWCLVLEISKFYRH